MMPCWHNIQNVHVLIVINSSHDIHSVSVTIIFRNKVISTSTICMQEMINYSTAPSVKVSKHNNFSLFIVRYSPSANWCRNLIKVDNPNPYIYLKLYIYISRNKHAFCGNICILYFWHFFFKKEYNIK